MYTSKEDVKSRKINSDQSHDCSIIINNNYSIDERISAVRSMAERLQITLEDIKNASNSVKLNSLSIIPPDLLPIEIKLADGQKVTVMETDPVVTCFDGHLTGVKGDIIHITEKEIKELPENFVLHKKEFTVNPDNLELILPQIIENLLVPNVKESNFLNMPGTSKILDTPSNSGGENLLLCTSVKKYIEVNNEIQSVTATESKDFPSKKVSDDIVPSAKDHTAEVSHSEVGSFVHKEYKNTCDDNFNISPKESLLKENGSSPFSSKIQVIGLVDTGILRDSGSEEGLHNLGEDFDNKEFSPKKQAATIILDKELGSPSDFRSVFFNSPSPVLKKVNVRKSARAHKPKIRSSFKSWDDLKIRLPRHSRKGGSSKSRQLKQKKKIKKSNQK